MARVISNPYDTNSRELTGLVEPNLVFQTFATPFIAAACKRDRLCPARLSDVPQQWTRRAKG